MATPDKTPEKKPASSTKKTTTAKKTTARKTTAKKVAEAVGKATGAAAKTGGSIVKGSVQTLTGLELPKQLQTAATNLEGYLSKVKTATTPQEFLDAGWKRVTDEQRKDDAQAFSELRNFAANLEDGLKTSEAMVKANTAKAKLATSLVGYATAVEGTNTAIAGYEIAQARTLKAQQDLTDAQRQTQHAVDKSQEREQLFVQELAEVRETVAEKIAAIEGRRNKRLSGTSEQ